MLKRKLEGGLVEAKTMTTIKLRLQTPKGSIIIDSLKNTDTFADLGVYVLDHFNLESIDQYKIVSRLLRRSFVLGSQDVDTKTLGEFFQSGDSLLLEVPENDKILFDLPDEPVAKKPNSSTSYGSNNIATMSSIENTVENDTTVKVDSNRSLKRFSIAANNSCFFLAFQYCITGVYQEGTGAELRKVVADYILAHPDRFGHGVLDNGRTTSEYASWIKKPESWGGAIEIQVLAEIHGVCIRVMNIKEAAFMPLGNEHHLECIYLRFDGVHYDALVAQKTDGTKITKFQTNDNAMFRAVEEYGRLEKGKSNYVDTSEMRFQCASCSAYCKDHRQMNSHTQQTGHSNFNQVK